MSKRDEYITFINEFKTVSPTISDEQCKGLLRRAVQQHDLTVEEATDILNTSGLVIGERIDYFEVLGLSISGLENQDELTIANRVDAIHKKLYRKSLNAGGRVRPDGKTEDQWRTLLNQARDTLKDAEKRQAHAAMLQNDVFPHTESFFMEEVPNSDTTSSNASAADDSMAMIPAGEFDMGSNDIESSIDEKPVHSVYIDAFYMDKHPVTNAQYREFVDANPQWRIHRWLNNYNFRKYRDRDYLKNWFRGSYPTGKDDHPVIWVSWYAAMAYAQWVGKRLPTEAEWEKAARGGLSGQIYPWGNIIDRRWANFDKRVAETTPIRKYPPNGYGLHDMAGNVSEWCLDEWNENFYKFSESHNPVSGGSIESIIENVTKSKTSRVIRGGSWYSSEQEARVSNRDCLAPWKTKSLIGFRCVRSVAP